MQRFKRIVVHVNSEAETQPALERAVQLATHNRAELKLVDLVEPLPWHMHGSLSRDMESSRLSDKQVHLDSLAGPIRAGGLTVDTKVLVESGDVELIREVLRGEHDLLMKVANARVSRREMFHSTLDQRLLRKCPCPVWLFKPTAPARFERILAAVDLTPDDSDHAKLNKTVLELASSLRATEGGELHVAHAWDIPDEDRLRQSLGNTAFQSVEKASLTNIQKALDRLLAQHAANVASASVHLLKGDPNTVILELADQQKIDLLIMGSVARTGVAGLFIGNTAERVLNEVGCSVLTVKPASFTTPVTLN